MRALFRFILAIVLAVGLSAALCSYAESRVVWPHWADFCCGHNTPLLWVLTIPLFFILLWTVPAFRQSRSFKE
jgi:hypothetical protein